MPRAFAYLRVSTGDQTTENQLMEIEAAGFILDAQSDVLRNPRDDHRLPVFDSRVRGQTDQVVFRFRKPLKAAPRMISVAAKQR